jgi:hypothetical protein
MQLRIDNQRFRVHNTHPSLGFRNSGTAYDRLYGWGGSLSEPD